MNLTFIKARADNSPWRNYVFDCVKCGMKVEISIVATIRDKAKPAFVMSVETNCRCQEIFTTVSQCIAQDPWVWSK